MTRTSSSLTSGLKSTQTVISSSPSTHSRRSKEKRKLPKKVKPDTHPSLKISSLIPIQATYSILKRKERTSRKLHLATKRLSTLPSLGKLEEKEVRDLTKIR